jgi:hypothetical protein
MEAETHLAIHISQYRSGQKLSSVAHDTDTTPASESIFSAFENYPTKENVDRAKRNNLLIKLFV